MKFTFRIVHDLNLKQLEPISWEISICSLQGQKTLNNKIYDSQAKRNLSFYFKGICESFSIAYREEV